MNVADVFLRITGPLDHAGISYMLSGSFASAFYGRGPRVIEIGVGQTGALAEADRGRRINTPNRFGLKTGIHFLK
jgi:hypothetical protein